MDLIKFFIADIELGDLEALAGLSDFTFDKAPVKAVVNGEDISVFPIGPVDFDSLFVSIKNLALNCQLIFRKGDKRYQVYKPVKKGSRSNPYFQQAMAEIRQNKTTREKAHMN